MPYSKQLFCKKIMGSQGIEGPDIGGQTFILQIYVLFKCLKNVFM